MGLSGGSLDALRRVGVRRRGCLELDQLHGRRVRLGIVEELADASLGERGHRSVCASDGERWLRATWWRGDEACGRRVSRVAAPHAPARARDDELFAREEGRKVPDVARLLSAARHLGLLTILTSVQRRGFPSSGTQLFGWAAALRGVSPSIFSSPHPTHAMLRDGRGEPAVRWN